MQSATAAQFQGDEENAEHPVSELLPWLFLTDNDRVVVNKDSSLMAVFEIAGIDVESADAFGLEDAAAQFDRAIRYAASNGVRIWTRADRHFADQYPAGEFTNAMAAEIDQLWGDTFRSGGAFTNIQTIAIAMPTQRKALSVAEISRDLIDDGQPVWKALPMALYAKLRASPKDQIGFETHEELEIARLRFEQNIITPLLQQLHLFKLYRLTGNELCGYLRSCTSVRAPHPVQVNEFSYLDAALSDTWIDNTDRDFLTLEGASRQYAAVLSLKDAPSANRMAALDSLMALPFRVTVATCWKASTPAKAISDLKSARTFDELRRMNVKSLLRTAVTKENELIESDSTPKTAVGRAAEDYISEIKDGAARWGYLACSVTVYGASLPELERNIELAQQVLEKNEMAFLREREGAISGYAVGIPGNVIDPLRWFHVEASNFTDLAPIISVDQGEPIHPYFSGIYHRDMPPVCVMRSRYGTAQNVSYHTGALGHTLYIGTSRNGKTLQKMFMTSQLLKYPNARSIIFDKDYGCEAATLMHGGTCIDLSPETQEAADGKGRMNMNPIKFITEPGGLLFLTGWIDRLMSSRDGQRLTDIDLETVNDALISIKGVPNASLTTLLTALPERLKERLKSWCRGGTYGAYFDHAEDALSFDDITCFELGGLIASGLTDVVRAFTDYVFFRVNVMVSDVTDPYKIGPTEIYFEEAGFLLEDPIFAEKAVDYLMTLAKKHAYLVMTAQSPQPFLKHERLRAAVRDNIATVIFLPNTAANRGELAATYKTIFGINDNHLELISTATPRREYCIWQPATGVFRVGVMQLPRAIVLRLMSDKTSRAELLKTINPQKKDWRNDYLERLELVIP